MASLLARLFGLHDNRRDARWDEVLPAPAHRPAPAPVAAPTSAELLPPLKNWCHPFKDTRQPLEQLTHLADAKAGYYPIGRSGLFHGGVHFDSGTGVTTDKSVHCLADGEVVAYRVDTQSPTTRYFINTLTVDKPFSRNFVLVRHRMQPPRINGSPDTPPSLIFYSLYMHLRDWQVYQTDPATTRPEFWPPSPTLRVKQTAKDVRPGQSEARGLNVRHADNQGQIIDLLPRGAAVTVSGAGRYRKLENSLGPTDLINADGSLKGYIAASVLQPMTGNEYRIRSSRASVYVRAEPVKTSRELRELPTGTVVTVSGEGEYRKLERVNQYVYFDMLEAEPEPLALDRIVVLDQPVPIKAAALIGHLGEYQDSGADLPEEKLHLEVFTDVEEIDLFLKDSRAWAKRLPEKDRTLLKLAKGTPVVAHQDNATASQLKARSSSSPLSAADLLVPKSLLDDLPAERKIHVPAGGSHNARHWYRLDGLLHDANNNLLNGWVCEEVGVTPWFSPWSWEGYDLIFDYNTSRDAMASFFSAVDRFTETQRERFRAVAEEDLKGPMKSRLYDIIDRNRDGKLTADELQAAMRLPAQAQAISQMILYKESEWFHNTQKWDALDELLGHSGSTPHLNWVAEKQRIEQMGWWGEVAKKLGFSSWGKAYHFHPMAFITNFSVKDECACGCCFGAKFSTTRYGQQYGPVYWGELKLADFKGWDHLVNSGAVTIAERAILVAMSENEGNLDALQSYDSEILTAGAMQKTINPQGAGELPQQIYEFKQEYPGLYQSLFVECGWEVKEENRKQILYYKGVTGSHLKSLLRYDFDQMSYDSKTKHSSEPLAALAHAITSDEYIIKQVMDFVRRLRVSISIEPVGYHPNIISSYIHSRLGRAIVLDHHVNRPGYVANDFGSALKHFYEVHSDVSEDPKNWGLNHARNESALLEIYGPARRMTDASLRYQSLKNKL